MALLSGRKRVIVLPPESWPALRIFPKAHPSDRSSQLVDDGSMGDLTSERHRARHVVVQAGDVLFVPEFWHHRVASTQGSLSVNTWSSHGTLGALLEHALPQMYETPVDRAAMDAAAFAIMKRVLVRAKPVGSRDFVRALIESQFVPVLLAAPACGDGFADDAKLDPAVLRVVEERADRALERLRSAVSPGVRDMMLLQLLQHIALWLGGVDGVADVLCCLRDALAGLD